MLIIELVFLFLLGLAFGSFFNVCISRIPAGKNLLNPSQCLKCGHRLRMVENIPILSYIILKGKCKKCGDKIPGYHIIVELITPVVFIALFIRSGLKLDLYFFKYLIFASFCIIVFFTDLKARIIPDLITLPLIFIGIGISLLSNSDVSFSSALIGGSISFVVFLFTAIVFERILKKESLGGGDIKLITAIGFYLGISGVVFTVIIASVIALIILLMFKYDTGKEFPFGPFLVTAALFYIFTGKYFSNLYINLLR